MQRLFVRRDLCVGHSGDAVGGGVQRQIDQQEGFLSLLLLNVERPHEPLIGQRFKIAVGAPRRECEQEAGN